MSTPVTQVQIPGIPVWKSGKVRDIFDFGDCFLFVASDRISAFDCVMPNGIPDKGVVLNSISAFWFDKLRDVVDHHLITCNPDEYPEELAAHRDLLAGRSMLVRKAELLPVECIVRGYLVGSGWKEYQRQGTIGGMPLRDGYRQADRLDETIFTPSTKAEEGHDENISVEQMREIIGPERAEEVMRASMNLYERAADYARERGIIIADTKFEFGLIEGKLTLVDEVLTPDSSRFWPADEYAPGQSPPSFDKQFVRDYLECLDWDKTPPAPELPEEIVRKTREKYLEAYRRLTGAELQSGGNS
ncbi:phosphoribosylaminoimidazolesuccinocarboxamide synthase [Kiritimatiella glycovorans]|uniref:Phosphoribosylaminoimidazole-succinocarboxamide synthase n=1 Tax=Kiritimatiella glycovorans TaxID=1307763 RepID=A0A0G3ECR2_9BACT|nr:phosphoribosylaminoimidazolesuccinocarboxamide synthase [Kiritimatiella glycovorans]AKJ64291.1 Phosphoribosylaminoimidazole-succinocarboxamide synthase [Kiritimatiella glycovorans]